MPKIKDADLPRFIDCWTIEYVRTYPHPRDRVWRAIISPAEFAAWFIPGSIELKAGGKYSFGGCADVEPDFAGQVVAIDPPRRIRFSGGPGNVTGETEAWFQFVLSEVKDGTRMVFTQKFAASTYSESPEEFIGGDLPVPGTPWKPGIIGGWHDIFDALRDHLAGIPIGSQLPPTEFGEIARYWTHENRRSGEFSTEQADRYARQLRVYENYAKMVEFYRDFIRDNWPPGEAP
jgi:uncharacterized protein YndB with AHSA1/START domain